MKLATIFFFFFLIFATFFNAQIQPKIEALDAELSTVHYPFPVQFKILKTQGQDLKMAFMDAKPAKPNGKTIVLLHGKNFNGYYFEQTAKVLLK